MKNILILIIATFVIFTFTLDLHSQIEENRIAIITDKSGMTTEVKNLDTTGSYFGPFDTYYRHIVVVTDKFEVAIPPTMICSITMDGKTANIEYQFKGKIKNISGELKEGSFEGDSDFGKYKLSTDKLKLLKFNTLPKKIDDKDLRYMSSDPCYATLVLTDGTNVSVSYLKRHDSYWSSSGYIVGGRTRYSFFDDIRFLRGNSLATIDFNKIQKIDFNINGTVTVILKNRNSTSGKLTDEPGAGVEGFTGLYDNGYFFIGASHIKSIIFQ